MTCMAKDPSPLLGYNNNIRHKNRVFHVQTEDSGVRHPHIITHLFMDGGRILKSVKTSYAEHLGVEKMADLVRKMMKDQHKGMLIALRDGQFDHVIDGGEAPKAAKSPSPSPSLAALEATSPSRADPPTSQAEPPSSDATAPPTTSPEAGLAAEGPRTSPSFDPLPSDLEPPPANLFRPRTGGNYSTVLSDDAPPDAVGPESRPRPLTGRPPLKQPPATPLPAGATLSRSGTTKPPPTPGAPGSRPSPASASMQPRPAPIRRGSSPPAPGVGEGASRIARRPGGVPVVTAKPLESRYASARPAAIFGNAKPRHGSSIFGEDIISDKSLDEVIMSYLADDSEAPKSSSSGTVDPKRRK